MVIATAELHCPCTARPSGNHNGPTIVPQSYGEKALLHTVPFILFSLSNKAFSYELLNIDSVLITPIHIFLSSKLNYCRNVTYTGCLKK